VCAASARRKEALSAGLTPLSSYLFSTQKTRQMSYVRICESHHATLPRVRHRSRTLGSATESQIYKQERNMLCAIPLRCVARPLRCVLAHRAELMRDAIQVGHKTHTTHSSSTNKQTDAPQTHKIHISVMVVCPVSRGRRRCRRCRRCRRRRRRRRPITMLCVLFCYDCCAPPVCKLLLLFTRLMR
jgi:hypothetical protein